MYIVIGILVFGILIIVHELGHFAAAKAFNVKVVEFSVGMGPRILKKQGKETLYSLRVLPLGGSCLMEGEDEEVPDPRSFTAQKRWKRFIILVAGSLMNFIFGALVVFILVSQMTAFVGTTITKLEEGFPLQGENGLMVGDTILEINGEKTYYMKDFGLFMGIYGGKPVDIVVLRDGSTVLLDDLPLKMREYETDGQKQVRYGISFNLIEGTAGEKLKHSAYMTMNYARLVRVSLTQLFTGGFGLRDLSGPVGIVSVINEVGQSEEISTGEKLASVANFGALIAINLAVMNLLPIPALDGGRIFFMVITYFIEKISRRRIDPKYEGYIHTATYMLLLGLMVVVMVNDVVKIVNG
jgi:regulator of sigma E protease